MQTSQTAAIAQQGRAAIDARRQAASYGRTEQRQALEDTYSQIQQTGQGYSSHPQQTPQFDQWMQSKGFGQQNYPVTFGRTDKGAYSGFKTEGELKAAILGQAELARQADMEQAGMMRSQLNERLGGLDEQYVQQAASPTGLDIAGIAGLGKARAEFNPDDGGFGLPDLAARVPLAQAAQQAGAQHGATQGYMGKLDDWYAQQTDPLISGLETANQMERVPTRQYATVSGANYGVDPNLIAGWFPMAQEITDTANQRDLQSLNETGLPYSEVQSVLTGMDREGQQMAQQQAADQQVQMDNDIYQATSYTGQALASAADAPVEAIHAIVTSEVYPYAAGIVEQRRAEAEAANPDEGSPEQRAASAQAIQDVVDAAIQEAVMQTTEDATSARVLDSILRAQYGA